MATLDQLPLRQVMIAGTCVPLDGKAILDIQIVLGEYAGRIIEMLNEETDLREQGALAHSLTRITDAYAEIERAYNDDGGTWAV